MWRKWYKNMRDPKRMNEVLQVLHELWSRYPDWRLTQLFCNMQRAVGHDMFYMEEDKLIDIMKFLIENGF